MVEPSLILQLMSAEVMTDSAKVLPHRSWDHRFGL